MWIFTSGGFTVRCPRTPVKFNSKSWMECNHESKRPVSGEQVRSHRNLVCDSFAAVVSGQPAPAQQNNDNEYTKKIKEYTTEPYFMTELVDHLPMSDKVPSPDKVLGYIVGTPNKLTYTKDIYRYYRELAKSTPRVRVFSAPERSEEGREQIAGRCRR